jgi:hypothetical protein
MLHCNYLNAVVLPDGFILDEYRDYFENFLIDISVPEEYYYSPTLFAENQYGTPDLDFLVLYFAKMTSLFEFNKPVIKFLPVTSLSDLNKLIVQNRVNVRNSKADPVLYGRLENIKLPIKGYLETSNATIITTSKSSVSRINTGTRSQPLPSNIDNSQENGEYDLPNVITNDNTVRDNTVRIDESRLVRDENDISIQSGNLVIPTNTTTTVTRTPTAYGNRTAPGGGDLKSLAEF